MIPNYTKLLTGQIDLGISQYFVRVMARIQYADPPHSLDSDSNFILTIITRFLQHYFHFLSLKQLRKNKLLLSALVIVLLLVQESRVVD